MTFSQSQILVSNGCKARDQRETQVLAYNLPGYVIEAYPVILVIVPGLT